MKFGDYVKNSIAFGAIGLGMFSGCDSRVSTKREISDTLYEEAVVSDAIYAPSQHGSSTSIDWLGDGGVRTVSVNVPKKYAVVFECQHGKFIIEGSREKHEALWKKCIRGKKMNVSYKEISDVIYEDRNGDGKKEPVEKRIVDYDFLNAEPLIEDIKLEKSED